MIASRDVPLAARQASDVEAAVQEISALDRSGGETLAALGVLLLRAESVASSRIKRIEASADDADERRYAGRPRDAQNWVGGSNYCPYGALFVPPPPELVDEYFDDLISFCHRDDMPALVQAAITHAQFESIHPFTDGNGRIGRKLRRAGPSCTRRPALTCDDAGAPEGA